MTCWPRAKVAFLSLAALAALPACGLSNGSEHARTSGTESGGARADGNDEDAETGTTEESAGGSAARPPNEPTCAPIECSTLEDCRADSQTDDCATTCSFVAPELVISDPADLAALVALHCARLETSLQIHGPGITSLAGLRSLHSVEGNVSIHATQLRSLEGLESLATATTMTIEESPELSSVELPALAELETLDVHSNDGLKKVLLPKLASAKTLLFIANPILSEIDIGTVQDLTDLRIAANPELVTFTGFDSLESVTLLYLTNNASLPQCRVEALSERVGGCRSCTGNDADGSCD